MLRIFIPMIFLLSAGCGDDGFGVRIVAFASLSSAETPEIFSAGDFSGKVYPKDENGGFDGDCSIDDGIVHFHLENHNANEVFSSIMISFPVDELLSDTAQVSIKVSGREFSQLGDVAALPCFSSSFPVDLRPTMSDREIVFIEAFVSCAILRSNETIEAASVHADLSLYKCTSL